MELENFKNYISEVKGDLENWHRDPEDMGIFYVGWQGLHYRVWYLVFFLLWQV